MTHETPRGIDVRTDRRTVLRTVSAVAIGTASAGCIGGVGDTESSRESDVVLDPPEQYETRKEADLERPLYSEALPDVEVPAPLHDTTISTREFVGERHQLLTFVYTNCQTVCPGLIAVLRQVQADALDQGYTDEVACLPMTFDPEHDTPGRLEEYVERMGVNRSADNWYFLRPETPADAERIVEDTFGVPFEAIQPGEDGHGNGEMADGTTGEGEEMTMFDHLSLVLLVNKGGFVERGYMGRSPSPSDVIDDTRTVVEEW